MDGASYAAVQSIGSTGSLLATPPPTRSLTRPESAGPTAPGFVPPSSRGFPESIPEWRVPPTNKKVYAKWVAKPPNGAPKKGLFDPRLGSRLLMLDERSAAAMKLQEAQDRLSVFKDRQRGHTAQLDKMRRQAELAITAKREAERGFEMWRGEIERQRDLAIAELVRKLEMQRTEHYEVIQAAELAHQEAMASERSRLSTLAEEAVKAADLRASQSVREALNAQHSNEMDNLVQKHEGELQAEQTRLSGLLEVFKKDYEEKLADARAEAHARIASVSAAEVEAEVALGKAREIERSFDNEMRKRDTIIEV